MEQQTESKGFISGLVTGFLIALVICICAGVPGGYWMVQKKTKEWRKGWNLIPVVVAADDIPKGTIVTFDMVSQRSVPEQFVTASIVKPDSASYVVNQEALVDIAKGDPLRWADFEKRDKAPAQPPAEPVRDP